VEAAHLADHASASCGGEKVFVDFAGDTFA